MSKKEESFTEKTLNRIRSGESAGEGRKKRKISRIFIVVDLILILAIIIYFTSDRKDDTYETSNFNYGTLDIRFSVAQDKERGDYLFSLSISSSVNGTSEYTFNESLASIEVKAEGRTLRKMDIGRGVTVLNFHSEEIKTFNAVLDRKILDDFALSVPRGRYKPRRTLFGTTGERLPVDIRITLNHKDGISTSVELQHRVEL